MPKAEKAEKPEKVVKEKVVKEKKPKAPPKEKKVKKEKKKKDPNAPKKPLSAYMFFCADKRDDVKKGNTEMKVTEVTSELGRLWKLLDEDAKKPYYEKAEEDKLRYKTAMETYKPSGAAAAPAEEEEEEEEEEDDE